MKLIKGKIHPEIHQSWFQLSSVHEANLKGNLAFPLTCFLVNEQGYAHPSLVSMSAQTKFLYTLKIKSLTVKKTSE